MRIALIFIAAFFVLIAALLISREPKLDRSWDPGVRVLAAISIEADRTKFTISNVRNWRYTNDRPMSRRYFDEPYRLADLAGTYLYEQILDLSGLIAHTFVVF